MTIVSRLMITRSTIVPSSQRQCTIFTNNYSAHITRERSADEDTRTHASKKALKHAYMERERERESDIGARTKSDISEITGSAVAFNKCHPHARVLLPEYIYIYIYACVRERGRRNFQSTFRESCSPHMHKPARRRRALVVTEDSTPILDISISKIKPSAPEYRLFPRRRRVMLVFIANKKSIGRAVSSRSRAL